MTTSKQKAFCALQFANTESAVNVQRAFRIKFGCQPPNDNNILRGFDQFETTGGLLGDNVQELLDSHDRELTIDELIEMHEQEQDIEELEPSDPLQSEDRMTVENSIEDLSLMEKGLQIFENIDSNDEGIFSTKQGIKKY
ncbi:hypothetical protein TNCV_1774971 [Trichonephila clavipes]|nr:hypothetical protein TNCV_1774971 [Trichonephila clavipes]